MNSYSVTRFALLLATVVAGITLFEPSSVDAMETATMLRKEDQGEQADNITLKRCCL